MSLKVGDVPGARFGSPARTVNLGEHPSPPAHEVNLKPGWVDKAGIGRVFRDWVSSSLEVDQKFILAHQYGFLVNVLLRHLPDDAKVKVFDDLLSNTTGFLKWERRNGNAGITTAHPLFKSFTHPFLKPLAANVTIERGSVNPQVSMHEAIHFMQMRKLMPHNNLLTFLVGSLIEIESGKKGLTRKENDSGGDCSIPII